MPILTGHRSLVMFGGIAKRDRAALLLCAARLLFLSSINYSRIATISQSVSNQEKLGDLSMMHLAASANLNECIVN